MSFPGDYNRRCKITINSAKIPSGTHSGVLVWLGNGWTPSEIRDADGSYPCQTNGADIRAALDVNGTMQVPCVCRRCSLDNNPANSFLSIFIRIPEIISGADFDFWIFYNSSETETAPAVDSTYGRNNVFQDYLIFYDFEETAPSPYNGETPNALINLTGNTTFNGDVHTWQSGGSDNTWYRAEANRMAGKRRWYSEVDDNSEYCTIDTHLTSNTTAVFLGVVTIEAVAEPQSGTGNNPAICDPVGQDGSWVCGFTAAGTGYTWGTNDDFNTTLSGIGANIVRHVVWRRAWGFNIREDGTQIVNAWAMPRAGGNDDVCAIGHYSNDDLNRCGAIDLELFGVRVGQYTNDRVTFNYRLFYGDTGTITVGTPEDFVTTVDITITVLDEDLSPINLCQVAVYKASDDTQLMNEDTNASGIATESFSYTADTDVYIRCRKSSSGTTRYVPRRVDGTITSSGLTQTVTLVEDTVAAA